MLKYFLAELLLVISIRVDGNELYPRDRHSRFEQYTQTCVERNTSDFASSLIKDLYLKIQEEECRLADPSDLPAEYFPSPGDEFDFIIVGAGPGGCVAANRLTENSSWTALLLEAGGNPTKSTEVPYLAPTLLGTDLDWQFRTEPEEGNCLGMKDKRCNIQAGKVLRGSSSISLLQYIRGSREVFNRWATSGNNGWDYESCLHYFKKSEDLNVRNIFLQEDSSKYHAEGGPISVDNFIKTGEESIVEAMKTGATETNYRIVSDFNGEQIVGFGELQATVINGRRCSSAKAFLEPIRGRNNLKVAKNVFVTKILINKANKAYGVDILNSKGKIFSVIARKEVIVCAGPVNSAKLLMLSGIGPRYHLEVMGIDCKKDLPVGDNFLDHPSHLGIRLSYKQNRRAEDDSDLMYDFLSSKTSVYSGLGITSVAFLINTRDKSAKEPDVVVLPVNWGRGNRTSLALLLHALNINDEISEQYFVQEEGRVYVLLLVSIVNAKSRGKVLLKSTDPLDYPKIFPGYLKQTEDIETILRGIDYVYELAATTKMKSLDAKIKEVVPPACQKYTDSKQRRICAMKHLVSTCFSYGGTCKMGPQEDPTAVVDPQLKVHGIDCLRVLDSSVIPSMPTGPLQAVAYMIAEKGADLVKESHCR